MNVIEVQIINKLGLHARAATQLVKICAKYQCDIEVYIEEEKKVNGKSIIGLLTLAAKQGSLLKIQAIGDQSGECLVEIKKLITNKFGEPM